MRLLSAKEKIIYDIIKPCIETKNLIRFYYEDTSSDFKAWRIVAPYMVYEHITSGKILLLGYYYPTSDQVLIGKKKDLKNYVIESFDEKKLEVLTEKFIKTDINYKLDNRKIAKHIYIKTPPMY